MHDTKKKTIAPTADRMGRFIGQLRVYEGVTLAQLAHGLCSPGFLGKIENGEREVGKQLTDTFFQRLGKPVELFERILDWGEFQQWTRRQEIIACLRHGKVESVRALLCSYLDSSKDARGKIEVLDRQFAQIIEINCHFLSGADAAELLPMVRDALLLTQPTFLSSPVEELLLSQNEGRLLFAYLGLREQLEGAGAVASEYRALLRYFKQGRYESRERVYLFPYVACRVIEHDYRMGDYVSALTTCLDALDELKREKRFFACERLLAWEQKLLDALENPDRMPEKLLTQLELIREHAAEPIELLIPCDERGHVYCLNQVIRDRRKLLGMSQETLAEGICDPRTLSRIENRGGNLHKNNRKELLQRVNMSGERYDYEVITDRYEDYLLRSELDRAIIAADHQMAQKLLETLRERVPDIPANRQYIMKSELKIEEDVMKAYPCDSRFEQMQQQIEGVIQLTLPLDVQNIDDGHTSILSVNEILTLITYAFHYKKRKMYEKCLSIFEYIRDCLQSAGTDVMFYEDLYTRVGINIASVLGDLGRYQESNEVTTSCLRLSLENQNTRRISQYLYGIAWNKTQQLSGCPQEDKARLEREVIDLLKQAFAAAWISGDIVRQKKILAFCLDKFNVNLEL